MFPVKRYDGPSTPGGGATTTASEKDDLLQKLKTKAKKLSSKMLEESSFYSIPQPKAPHPPLECQRHLLLEMNHAVVRVATGSATGRGRMRM